jgi:hypothetical protein
MILFFAKPAPAWSLRPSSVGEMRGTALENGARREDTMSQPNVERVIGILATDESLRREFIRNPRVALELMKDRGMELTECEQWAIATLDPNDLARFAAAVDARLQKSDLHGGRP